VNSSRSAPHDAPPRGDVRPADLIIIGCSAGGPPALLEILPRVPRRTTTAVVVAQHMPKRFTSLFAGQQTTLDRLPPGIVFRVRPRAPSERYAPSADLLMASAAGLFGPRALGILMTGMGGDGVLGLRAIKDRHGRTIAESEETAAVFGMPREAIRAGLADLVLPRPEIALEMARLCRR